MNLGFLNKVLVFKSMTSRIFAVLLLGIICSAALTLWLAFGERQTSLSNERSSNRTERARHTLHLVYAVNALPPKNRQGIRHVLFRLGIKMLNQAPPRTTYKTSSLYAQFLIEQLSPQFTIYPLSPSAENCFMRPDQADRPEHDKNLKELCEALIIILEDGSAIQQNIFPTRSAIPPIQESTILFLFMFLSFIAGLAFLVSRMTIRPLAQLAQAATDLGQDINRPALLEKGSSEILLATRAFNAMQRRIRDHIHQRTHMLAAITHDLQTPLTRLRLRLEKVRDAPLRDKLIEDLLSMQSMIKEGLDLARSMDSNEQLRPLDIDSLLDSICTDASDSGQDVTFLGKSGFTVMARPQALQRCLNNIIDNAIKYGHCAKIDLQTHQIGDQKYIDILIRDDGPGIPIDQQNKVFDPFYRIESSRSRDTGGTGLGLTIALNIARQHNGDLQLKNLPEGGLEVCLSLPIKETQKEAQTQNIKP